MILGIIRTIALRALGGLFDASPLVIPVLCGASFLGLVWWIEHAVTYSDAERVRIERAVTDAVAERDRIEAENAARAAQDLAELEAERQQFKIQRDEAAKNEKTDAPVVWRADDPWLRSKRDASTR